MTITSNRTETNMPENSSFQNTPETRDNQAETPFPVGEKELRAIADAAGNASAGAIEGLIRSGVKGVVVMQAASVGSFVLKGGVVIGVATALMAIGKKMFMKGAPAA